MPLFAIIREAMMIPYRMTMIPLFTLFRNMGWFGGFPPLTVPGIFGSAFYIILPLTKSALAAAALFQFLGAWGDYLGPLISLSDKDRSTASLDPALFQGQCNAEFGGLIAASTVMMLPIVMPFFLTKRTFIQGIALTGIEE